jgi:hypothetical protein
VLLMFEQPAIAKVATVSAIIFFISTDPLSIYESG